MPKKSPFLKIRRLGIVTPTHCTFPNLINLSVNQRIKDWRYRVPKHISVGNFSNASLRLGYSNSFHYPFFPSTDPVKLPDSTGITVAILSNVKRDQPTSQPIYCWRFLHIDDKLGMEPYLRKEIDPIFPDPELNGIGADPTPYSAAISIPKGLPKKGFMNMMANGPQAFGISIKSSDITFTFESDLLRRMGRTQKYK